MKTRLLLCILIHLGQAAHSQPMEAANHPPHKMVLVGDQQIFASHIVYKRPHNFQVLLEVKFDGATLSDYRLQRSQHPNDRFLLILEHVEISKIAESKELRAAIVREDTNGQRREVTPQLRLGAGEFELLFFNEIPVDLN